MSTHLHVNSLHINMKRVTEYLFPESLAKVECNFTANNLIYCWCSSSIMPWACAYSKTFYSKCLIKQYTLQIRTQQGRTASAHITYHFHSRRYTQTHANIRVYTIFQVPLSTIANKLLTSSTSMFREVIFSVKLFAYANKSWDLPISVCSVTSFSRKPNDLDFKVMLVDGKKGKYSTIQNSYPSGIMHTHTSILYSCHFIGMTHIHTNNPLTQNAKQPIVLLRHLTDIKMAHIRTK